MAESFLFDPANTRRRPSLPVGKEVLPDLFPIPSPSSPARDAVPILHAASNQVPKSLLEETGADERPGVSMFQPRACHWAGREGLLLGVGGEWAGSTTPAGVSLVGSPFLGVLSATHTLTYCLLKV